MTENTNGTLIGQFDQDGQVFTTNVNDQVLFPHVRLQNPKRHRLVSLVVQDGVICTRKQFPQRRSSNPLRQFRSELGFWVEAAALLRLQGLPYVPRVVRIEPENTAITMEYIRGENLRTILQARSNDRKYESLEHTFVEALEKAGPAIASKVGRMLLGLLQRGVAPRDVNAANFILARSSGRLYVVDFHLSWLRPVLPFHREAEAINEIVRTISVGSLRV